MKVDNYFTIGGEALPSANTVVDGATLVVDKAVISACRILWGRTSDVLDVLISVVCFVLGGDHFAVTGLLMVGYSLESGRGGDGDGSLVQGARLLVGRGSVRGEVYLRAIRVSRMISRSVVEQLELEWLREGGLGGGHVGCRGQLVLLRDGVALLQRQLVVELQALRLVVCHLELQGATMTDLFVADEGGCESATIVEHLFDIGLVGVFLHGESASVLQMDHGFV